MTTATTQTHPALYHAHVLSPDGRLLVTLAQTSDPSAPTYQVRHPHTGAWLDIPSSYVTLLGNLDLAPGSPKDSAGTWEYCAIPGRGDGWTFHPAPAQAPLSLELALHAAACKASRCYPNEEARIQRGLAIAQADGVTLLADGTAVVASQVYPDTVSYRVNGRCGCIDSAHAPEGRCKHKWSVSLVRWANKRRTEAQACL